MGFILLLFLTAFAMEAIGTYISVIGLGSLFAGDPVILLMACIFDVAKIVSVSFLYQNWMVIKNVMKYYISVAVIVLMTITSGGIFGYLSGAFQKAMQPNMEVSLKVDSYSNERAQLSNEKEQLKVERINIDKQIASLPTDYVRGRTRLINSFKPESERISSRLILITKRIDELNDNILKVESQSIETRVHAGPITYVAKAFNVTIEEASKWIILTIIFVFDPLAVFLILAGNFLVKKRKEAPPKVEAPKQTIKKDEARAIELEKELEKLNQEWLARKLAENPDDGIFAGNEQVDKIIEKQTESDKSSEVPESRLMIEPTSNFDEDTWEPPQQEAATPKQVDVNTLWGLEQIATGGETREDEVVQWQLPKVNQPVDEFAELLSKIYDDFDTGEATFCYEDSPEPAESLIDAIEEYVPVQPETQTPVIDVAIESHFESSPQTKLIEEPPSGLNVKELIAAAKSRVNKVASKPELLKSSLESLKINAAEVMLNAGHPASHVRNVYE